MDDLISREAAIKAICAICGNDCDKSAFIYNAPQTEQVILCPEHYCLCTLPTAQPEPKKGHWLIDSDGYYPYCSECRTEPNSGHMTDFCPNCGADMRKERKG